MFQSRVNLEQQVLSLPRGERARMALHLLDSLESNEQSASKNAIEKEWIDESLHRLEAYQRGEMQSYSVEEVIADLEQPAK